MGLLSKLMRFEIWQCVFILQFRVRSNLGIPSLDTGLVVLVAECVRDDAILRLVSNVLVRMTKL